MSIHGIDVSQFQGDVNWENVKKSGVQFVMIRAGFGLGNIDPQFLNNVTECSRLGILFGVYWFSYAYTEEMARREAEYCIEAVSNYNVHYPICFDFEYASVEYARSQGVEITREIATALVTSFCNRVEELGYFAMYYSNLDYLQRMFAPSLRSKYALWYAQYAPNPAESGMAMWQYRSDGTIPGITGDVDQNIAYYDLAKVISEKGLNRLKEPITTPDRPENTINSTISYTIKVGDTLSEIALRYGTTYENIAAYNQISNPDLIYAGQVIRIPIGSQSAGTKYYTIKQGDTLSEIAVRFGTTVAQLQRINGIQNPNRIYAGVTIKV